MYRLPRIFVNYYLQQKCLKMNTELMTCCAYEENVIKGTYFRKTCSCIKYIFLLSLTCEQKPGHELRCKQITSKRAKFLLNINKQARKHKNWDLNI
jgi:hypothetical protein